MVQQDLPQFPGTIAENIAFARPVAPTENVERAAEAAGAVPFIEAMPEAYQSLVREAGQNL